MASGMNLAQQSNVLDLQRGLGALDQGYAWAWWSEGEQDRRNPPARYSPIRVDTDEKLDPPSFETGVGSQFHEPVCERRSLRSARAPISPRMMLDMMLGRQERCGALAAMRQLVCRLAPILRALTPSGSQLLSLTLCQLHGRRSAPAVGTDAKADAVQVEPSTPAR